LHIGKLCNIILTNIALTQCQGYQVDTRELIGSGVNLIIFD